MEIAQSEIQSTQKRVTLFHRYSYKWMYAGLLTSDLAALLISLGAGILIRKQVFGSAGIWEIFIGSLPGFMTVTILIYILLGQYKLGGTDPVDELRSLSLGTCFAFLLFAAFTFFTQTSSDYSRLIFLLSWFLALIFVPIFRFILRIVSSKLNIWGVPVIVLGSGPTTHKIVDYIANQSQLGWRTNAVIGTGRSQYKLNAVRTQYLQANSEVQCKQYLNLYRSNTIIIVQSEVPASWIDAINNPTQPYVRKIVVIPSFEKVQNTIVKAHDIAGSLGLELQQNLSTPWGRLIKRMVDILMASTIGILALPAIGILAILIKLDSKGGVFYRQIRIGYKGQPFECWKFRTMFEDADQTLQKHLEKDTRLRLEWDEHQKLKDDPRITRMGQILRKLSLDELPQLWNILRGEMSMVGPRPCMPEQTELYGDVLELYKSVCPGITGLWQVSGRNNTSYEDRVYYDGTYVRNWSIWLDIYILIKTVWVVISREGAY